MNDNLVSKQPSMDQAGASPDAISEHYDVSDDFFRLWIGPDLVYSAAMFAGADDLASAQVRKLDFHIDAAKARGAARVLDVGCGWGALLRRMVEHAGVSQAVGLTISPSQAAIIRKHDIPGIEVREEDWRDHKPSRPYDAIVSIGAFEHFVRPGMSRERKLEVYGEFFAFCHDALVEGGRLSLQTIAYVASSGSLDPHIAKTFRDSDLPAAWEPAAAADEMFELVALRNDRDHYYRTLRLWEQNLSAQYEAAVALVGEATVESFRRYLRIAAAGFRLGSICLLRMSFVKRPSYFTASPQS